MPRAAFSLATPSAGGGALAVIHLAGRSAEDLEAALRSLGVAPPGVGRFALADLAGVDRGIVARWTPTCAQLMPHGGALVVRELCRRLASTPGLAPLPDDDPRVRYPEADDLVEACMLDALARAASPLAIDVLLRQCDLWRASPSLWEGVRGRDIDTWKAAGERGAESTQTRAVVSPAEARSLSRLLDPPMVVLLGPPNAGKSTLTNALARRPVSIVADEPGTTRDHVGVVLDLAGLVVRWIDAPGINPNSTDPIERAAIDLALAAAQRADLILLCHDGAGPPASFARSSVRLPPCPVLDVLTRADLAPPGLSVDPFAAATAGLHRPGGRGLAELALAVREALVPSRLLTTDALWRFHPNLPA